MMRILVYLILIALVSFWLTIVWGTLHLHATDDTEQQVVRPMLKRPICIVKGQPHFCTPPVSHPPRR